jgi:hypothetical protein
MTQPGRLKAEPPPWTGGGFVSFGKIEDCWSEKSEIRSTNLETNPNNPKSDFVLLKLMPQNRFC